MTTSASLECLCCKQPVGDEPKIYAAVLCCARCYTIATRLYERSEQDLKALLLTLKESIRLALLRGDIALASEDTSALTKKETLSMILKLQDQRRDPG